MGYAMAGDGVECYDGLLPLSAVEGNERRILGNFINFMETLYKNLKDVPAAAALDGWARILRQLKDCFFNLTEQNIYEHQALNEILERLDQIHHCIANPGKDLPFEVIRQHLIALLEKSRRSGGYITGGVTFCAALPMRSIPAEVICMVGLNHDIFPRDVQEPAFNLMASNPRIGDRSQRDDDKYLFLETLVSARSVFYLSYIGRGIQDNAPIPPSVLVEELADYLSEKMGVRRDQLVCVHPLHPFSVRYFGGEDDRFFSYSMDAFQASRSLDQIKTDSAPFIDAALPEAPPSWHNCEPFDIVEFFNHPARYLLYRRLGIRFEEEGEADGDREVFTLDALGNFRLGQMLLDDYLRGRTSRQAYLAAKASGNLPHGTMGNALHQKVSQEVRAFINRLESGMGTQAAMIEPRVDFTMVGIEMSGMLDGAYENGVFHFRLGQDRPQDLIRTFISHLIAHQCPGIAPPIHSRLICKKAAWNFDEVADAGSVLEFYLNLYRQGLARPLPFFPRTSFAYAQQRLARSASPHTAMSAARRAWQGNEYAPGDSMDLYNQRCFDGKDPLTKEFEELAVGVFDPLFKAGRRQPAGPVLD